MQWLRNFIYGLLGKKIKKWGEISKTEHDIEKTKKQSFLYPKQTAAQKFSDNLLLPYNLHLLQKDFSPVRRSSIR